MSSAPYEAALGCVVDAAGDDAARVRLPFQDANANPGGVLHGGVTASLVGIAAVAAARAGSDAPAPGEQQALVDLMVCYLAAAQNEDVTAVARVLRRGKELAYVEIDVATDRGKPIARALATHRSGPSPREGRVRDVAAGPPLPDLGAPPAFARIFAAAPFMARLGLASRGARDGEALAVLPWRDEHAGDGGTLHPGAIAALVDTTAAMASWSLVQLDPRNKAGTPDMHVAWLAPAAGEDVVAYARMLRRREELFQNAVSVIGARTGAAVARGTVTYRIVEP